MQKLKEEDIPVIKARVAAGESQQAVADSYGVTRSCIGCIIRGTTFAGERGKTGPKPKTLEEKFWAKVDPGPEDECWLWKGGNGNGTWFGSVTDSQGERLDAHRASFEIHFRPLEEGERVYHSCDGPRHCVNPNHLYVGNQVEWSRKAREANPTDVELARQKNRERVKEHYAANREKRIAYSSNYQLERKIAAVVFKGGKCQRCGFHQHPAAMEFHHRDPATKKFNVSSKQLGAPNKFPWGLIQEELAKCDLLCANCHAMVESKWQVEEGWNVAA